MTTEPQITLAGKIFMTIIFLIIGLLFAVTIDKFFLNDKFFNKLVYGSDCNYAVPKGYSIIQNIEGEYAVAVLQFGDYYLYNGRHGIRTMFSSIAKPETFKDSCGAKGYLKAYIKDNEVKFIPR